jgi:hypothetical protein
MGEWTASVITGLCAGVLVAVLAFAFRGAAPRWAAGGRLAALIVAAVLLGAALPVALQRPPAPPPAGFEDTTLTRIRAALESGEQNERLDALEELDNLMHNGMAHGRETVELLSGFVRKQAAKADDPACADSGPAEDVAVALSVLAARPIPYDEDAVVDLHGTCLAFTSLQGLSAHGGRFGDANLAGAMLKSSDLTRADLARANLAGASLVGTNLVDTRFVDARFAETDLSDAVFSDDTLWPSQHEDAVMAASSFATTTFVIGELVLSDPR